MTISELLLRLWHHFPPRRQHQFWLLAILILFSAAAEVVSLGAVLPFLGVVTTPERVMSYPVVAMAAKAGGIHSADQLVLPLIVAFVTAVIIAAAVRMLFFWASSRLAYACGAALSNEIYLRTLYQPYHVHVARNSSQTISTISAKANDVVSVLLAISILIGASLLLLAITAALLAINPVVALEAGVGFAASYILISLIVKKRVNENSRRIADARTQAIKALQEGLGGIRDVLLDGTQQAYFDIYLDANNKLSRAQSSNLFLGIIPRPGMEAFGMMIIAFITYSFSNQEGGVAAAVPVLGVLALASLRLLPAMQQSYGAWVAIVGCRVSLADTVALLDQPLDAEALQPIPIPLPLDRTIRFNCVNFRYTPESPMVLENFSLTIAKGTRVGLVGRSGSGKSTTLDILMGLLSPTEGELLVDGQPIIGSRVRAWQKNIAHVPQNIYLADASLAQNIAFGIPRDAIDLQRVQQAAKRAQIAEFIENRPEGYNALVGERGVRLSGGQRQRIGIARALYKQASVVVFDEATSALDNATEQAVLTAIEQLDGDLTILIVAHRVTTLRQCDVIVEIEHGRVVARGTYQQLLEYSPSFRQMANVAR